MPTASVSSSLRRTVGAFLAFTFCIVASARAQDGLARSNAADRTLSAVEKRNALIIGVWEYTDPMFVPLPGIDSDVRRMETKLRELGFRVTTVVNPTLRDAKAAVDDFGARLKAEGSVGLFYFSGHGCEHEGENFLIPKGTQIRSRKDLVNEALSAQRALNRMEEAGNGVNVVLLDACRNSLSKGAESGLVAMEAEGTFIGFATGSQKTASATREGSVYTEALLKHLATPGVSITDMHTLVTREVKLLTAELGRPQVPFQYSGLDRVFFLVPPSGSSPSVPVHRLDEAIDDQRKSSSVAINQGARDQLAVKMSKARYQVGEALGLTISSDRDGFVRVVQFGADGSTTQLLPNAYAPDNAIRGGTPLELPDSRYVLRTNPPAGAEKIVVFFSVGQFKGLPPTTRGLPFPEIERSQILTTRGRITVEAAEEGNQPTEVVGTSVSYELAD